MNHDQFTQLADEGYNRIPLVKELLADLETPLSCYLKAADGKYSFLLESVHGGETWGRYSIVGLPCKHILKISGSDISVFENGALTESLHAEQPLDFVDQYRQRYKAPELEGLPTFHGGLVGYFSYDTVRYIEPRLVDSVNEDELHNPDILLMLADELIVFDNFVGSLKIIVHCDPSNDQAFTQGQQRLEDIAQLIRNTQLHVTDLQLSGQSPPAPELEYTSRFSRSEYEAGVNTIKDYILQGDCMQAVLSQRLSAPFDAAPVDLYRVLRMLNPSPYMYFLNLDDFHIVGSSPEILARSEQGKVTVRPIAGTRKRGRTDDEDKALESELLADPKELAEHLMLIDLGRNDVGRIANTGSVTLDEKMIVERYSHVMHIVSKVSGRLKENVSPIDVLRACLPAGTLSGAPKIRAMEIIDELEPVKRGVYGGAVGYISWQGDMDTAIAIRTAVIQNNTLHIQAGAGIVADSQPELEWEECMNKARAVFKAAALAQANQNKGA